MSVIRKDYSIRSILVSTLSVAALSCVSIAASAQDAAPPEDDEEQYDTIVVSATRIRQGGAQDIKSFRATAMNEGMPENDALTIEGLMGEHDLTLTSDKNCNQLMCINARAMKADLPTRPQDKYFVGLGFDSNIDAVQARREPLNLVAVIDRSGSMSDEPIALVKQSLRQIIGQMRDGDRISLIIYGSTSLVHLDPTDIKGNKSKILKAIDSIEIDGSTNMEEGLEIGYRTAFAEAPTFDGKTRVMLFTDEQPNTGATDAASFMGMAQEASRRGIGLTTIGVSVDFDGELATKVSSVRGGNLFFIAEPDQVETVFGKEFENMVNEVAHDITITMMPKPGYAISGVFGVPDGLLTEGKEGAMTITVPTAFLSSNGGGIFVTLADSIAGASGDANGPMMNVALSYTDAKSGEQHNDRYALDQADKSPEKNLVLAQALVDQFSVMTAATLAFHKEKDFKTSYRLLYDLDRRMENSGLDGLKDERKLIGTMMAYAGDEAGLYDKLPKAIRHRAVLGEWKVISVKGMDDLYRGDVVEFTENGEMITTFKRERRGEDYLSQSFAINENEILIRSPDAVRDPDFTMRYSVKDDRLRFYTSDGFGEIRLERVKS